MTWTHRLRIGFVTLIAFAAAGTGVSVVAYQAGGSGPGDERGQSQLHRQSKTHRTSCPLTLSESIREPKPVRTIDARMWNGLTALKTVPIRRIFFVTEHRLSIVSEIASAHLTFDLLWSFRSAVGNEIEMTTLNMFGQDRRLPFATMRAVEESFIQSFVTAIFAP